MWTSKWLGLVLDNCFGFCLALFGDTVFYYRERSHPTKDVTGRICCSHTRLLSVNWQVTDKTRPNLCRKRQFTIRQMKCINRLVIVPPKHCVEKARSGLVLHDLPCHFVGRILRLTCLSGKCCFMTMMRWPCILHHCTLAATVPSLNYSKLVWQSDRDCLLQDIPVPMILIQKRKRGSQF